MNRLHLIKNPLTRRQISTVDPIPFRIKSDFPSNLIAVNPRRFLSSGKWLSRSASPTWTEDERDEGELLLQCMNVSPENIESAEATVHVLCLPGGHFRPGSMLLHFPRVLKLSSVEGAAALEVVSERWKVKPFRLDDGSRWMAIRHFREINLNDAFRFGHSSLPEVLYMVYRWWQRTQERRLCCKAQLALCAIAFRGRERDRGMAKLLQNRNLQAVTKRTLEIVGTDRDYWSVLI